MAEQSATRRAFDATALRDLVSRYRDALEARREELDALNVFPVPDGDTGTNLLLTVRSALDGADGLPEGSPEALSRGALMGARGNSGVILSQVIRALADSVDAEDGLDSEGVAAALARARDLAYQAVANPVEGTMLTAVRVAAECAQEAARDADLPVLAERVCERVREAVERTTEQLEALREAGVVDAGARGFEVLCGCLADLAHGREGTQPPSTSPLVHRTGPVGRREGGSLEYRFEVQYLLEAPDDVIPGLRERLGRLGDSVVVVGGGDLLNVHVHTNEVGQAIEEGLADGRPSRIQVTSFADQIEERARAQGPSDPEEDVPPLACVAVLPSGALAEAARGLGAVVVEGVGGDLPSVADLVKAVSEARGGTVAILPGHRNAVPAAEQAAEMAAAEDGREIEIVAEAVSPPEVLSALSVWVPGGDVADALSSLREVAAAVRSGEIVEAVRDADTPLGRVAAGDFLAVCDGDHVAASSDPIEALTAAARCLGADGAEVVTLMVGDGVPDDEREEAVAAVEGFGAHVDVVDGGQRPARYLLGVER
ncbi:MAG: DAK2 domain-containing protein [Nitriliruptorales bacterium]